jgi:hypothetical protein
MTRIRVDPDLLRDIAKDFEKTSKDILDGGDNIFSVAISMPSYDGQLSTPAKKTGYEVQSRSKTLSGYYKHDSEVLIEVANRNEVIDKQVVRDFEESRKDIGDYIREGIKEIVKGIGEVVTKVIHVGEYVITIITTDMKPRELTSDDILKLINNEYDGHDRGGNFANGYDYDPATDTLVIWFDHEVYVFDNVGPDRDEWPVDAEKYCDAIDAWDEARAEILWQLGWDIFATGFDFAAIWVPGIGPAAVVGISAKALWDSLHDLQGLWDARVGIWNAEAGLRENYNPSSSSNTSNPFLEPATSSP